ncbi:hypothetical protein J3E64_001231 [Sphingobium sp. OAS761]|uniref:hypothetical protein n=1 Tax=Sphingobium sp. OAS761 TaxID=2817901 RepID=UPI0020A0C863|nr:hypothetical protein [Sphingobium sp. OAS761]MCP1469556.1 hypothetical protein [Sphingobium sp. OAS761]
MGDEISGMTVNERLFTVGLLEAFENALAAGDDEAAGEILDKMGLYRDAEGMFRSL